MSANIHKVEKVRVGGMDNRVVLDVVKTRRFVDREEAEERFQELKETLSDSDEFEVRLS
jgi:hypothetical protein